ncbi:MULTISPECIES: TVP38/TMEM64 family protein [Calditerrivibrio]|jgi:uncharacterized membrane protein YdjX (TVP38/TMEM64 family)|uniref:TVP38/TMEM64 family protein n=1 Tax=Calditerrivibrio TaxID=545865 RepID=UPI003C7211A6
MKRFGVFVIIFSIFLVIRFSGVAEYLTLENLQKYKVILEEYVHKYFFITSISYIILYILVVTFSIPGASVLSLAGGYIFGLFPGLLYINFSAVAGATLAFLAARYIIGDLLQKKYAEKLHRFNEEMEQNGHLHLLTLRFVPIFPFFMVNIFAALTNVKLYTYIWTTAVGIFPASIAFTYAGKTLANIRSVDEVLSKELFFALILLGIVSQLPRIIKTVRKK